MRDLRKECINKMTDEILNILKMNVQLVSSTDDRNTFTQPNRVVLDHLLGYWTTLLVYVTQPYVAT